MQKTLTFGPVFDGPMFFLDVTSQPDIAVTGCVVPRFSQETAESCPLLFSSMVKLLIHGEVPDAPMLLQDDFEAHRHRNGWIPGNFLEGHQLSRSPIGTCVMS